MNELITSENALSKVILEGDLSKLSANEKVDYYQKVCESCGLNWLTIPFLYIRFQGKEVLYAGKNCTEQLRDIHGISLRIVARDKLDDLYIVTAEATNKHGRMDSSTGAVNLKGLAGEALANALMKAETKAKRRVTLSLAGLGFLDESEVDTIEGATKIDIDMQTGEIINGGPAFKPKKHKEKTIEATVGLELLDLLERAGSSEEQFLKKNNMTHLLELPISKYEKLIPILMKKIEENEMEGAA